MADAAGGGAKVGPERQLTIRPRRHEVISPALADDAGVERSFLSLSLSFSGNRHRPSRDLGGWRPPTFSRSWCLYLRRLERSGRRHY